MDEKNIISKTYTHRCEPAQGGRGNLKRLLCRFAPRNDNEENRELEGV